MRHFLYVKNARVIARLVAAASTAMLASCGGGYGSGGGGGSGPMGCGGPYGNPCPAPTIALTAPAAGATVSGTAVMLSATAAAASGLSLTRVDFSIDGAVVGTATTSPYSMSWNSTTATKGNHMVTATATDNMSDATTTPAITINVQNAAAFAVVMTPGQVFPMPSSSAAAMADLAVNLETGAITGTVTLRGMGATAVTIHEAFAGATGTRVVALAPSTRSVNAWDVPSGTLLAPEQLTALQQGKLYVLAASAAYPRGEIRGQITPDNISVVFSSLARTEEARSNGVAAAAGEVAATLNRSANLLSVEVNSTGIDDANAAETASDVAAAHRIALAKDSFSTGHWSAELAAITAADAADFSAGRWYVTVATPTVPRGAIRGQVR
jgi:hypothetical protein